MIASNSCALDPGQCFAFPCFSAKDPFRLVSPFHFITVMIEGCLDRLIASVKVMTQGGLYLVSKSRQV